MNIFFTNEKLQLLLRKWSISDINSLLKYANNKKISDNLTDAFPHPYTIESAKKFIEFANTNPNSLFFAIDFNGEAIGGIGLHQQTDIHRLNAEMGYWLAEPFWGKGIITNAIKHIIKIGFEQLEINRIFARPFGRNIASQKALEKAGFKLEARLTNTIVKNDILEDELIYAIRKN